LTFTKGTVVGKRKPDHRVPLNMNPTLEYYHNIKKHASQFWKSGDFASQVKTEGISNKILRLMLLIHRVKRGIQ
jgi:hypothetical protein